jgi:hypothetical protein
LLKVPYWVWLMGWDEDDWEEEQIRLTLAALAAEARLEQERADKEARKLAGLAARQASLERARAIHLADKQQRRAA